MILTLGQPELLDYVSLQLGNFFPDKSANKLTMQQINAAVERAEFCFSKIKFYNKSGDGKFAFNHLHSDQYLTFLWYLSNEVWTRTNDPSLSSKIYYLNKVLHSFDSLYDNNLPSIFFIAHGIGTLLGKANYADYLYVCKGVTVGASRGGEYPIFQERVSLGADSTVIGKLVLETGSSVGAGVCLFNKGVKSNYAAIRDESGSIKYISQMESLSRYVFHD